MNFRSSLFVCFIVFVSSVCPIPGVANGDKNGSHGTSLHFSHPIITENPSPDNKRRLDYVFKNDPYAEVQSIVAGREFKLSRGMSIEVEVPYRWRDPVTGNETDRFGNAGVALKLANYQFAESGLLLLHGLEFGLPTGDEGENIGNNNILEVAALGGFG